MASNGHGVMQYNGYWPMMCPDRPADLNHVKWPYRKLISNQHQTERCLSDNLDPYFLEVCAIYVAVVVLRRVLHAHARCRSRLFVRSFACSLAALLAVLCHFARRSFPCSSRTLIHKSTPYIASVPGFHNPKWGAVFSVMVLIGTLWWIVSSHIPWNLK